MTHDIPNLVSPAQLGQTDFLKRLAPDAKRHKLSTMHQVQYFNGYNREAADCDTAFSIA